MCFRENNNGGSKWACKSEHVKAINFFHDVNSLHTVTNIHPKISSRFTKVINVFRSENLALFTVASIHKIQKVKKNGNSETRWKLTDRQKIQDCD